MENSSQFNQFVSKLLSESRNMIAPFDGTFELTPRCNLNCKMCYVRLTQDK